MEAFQAPNVWVKEEGLKLVDYLEDDEEEESGLGNKEGKAKMEASQLRLGPNIPTNVISIDDSSSNKPSWFMSFGGSKARTKGKKRYVS